MVRAIVLAAGASSRMGTPKAALRLGSTGETFVSRLVRRMLDAGLPEVVVVTGAAPDAVRRAVGRVRQPPVRFSQNDNWAAGQLTSLLTGLEDGSHRLVEGALVTLVDTPLVATATISKVLRVWRETRAPIVRPARGDVHGHPVLFDRAIFDELRNADPSVGAKTVVRAHASRIINVPVEDEGAFIDIDTPDDYQQAVRQLSLN